MQQFYGLNMDGMGDEYSHLHAAALCSQLPASSRVAAAQAPELSWSSAEYLLSSISDGINWLVWSRTKDAEKGRNRPERNPTPADRARIKRRLDATDRDFVDRVLGTMRGGGRDAG